jgi:hypothetical protein
VRAGLEVVTGVAIVRPYVAQRRQGEGDYRRPYPAITDYPATAGLLDGRVWTTRRAAVSLTAWLGTVAWLDGDIGWQRGTAVGHEAGRDEDGIVGRVRLGVRTGAIAMAWSRRRVVLPGSGAYHSVAGP